MKDDPLSKMMLSPSAVTGWLECEHYLKLKGKEAEGLISVDDSDSGEFEQLIRDRGFEHEADCLDFYKSQGYSVYEVPKKDENESFQDWVKRIGNPLADDYDVIFQMPLIHDGLQGVADFIVRRKLESEGTYLYEPVDAKLARNRAAPGHVMQLLFYSEAIESITGQTPEYGYLYLGSGSIEKIRLVEVDAYWRRLRVQLSEALEESINLETVPDKCSYCSFCSFHEHCTQEWRSKDSLIYVSGAQKSYREVLEASGVRTLVSLANLDEESMVNIELDPRRIKKLSSQAKLQLEARRSPSTKPPFRLFEEEEMGEWNLATLPKPDEGDVFLDFEGHPFWRTDRGLLFLFGYIVQNDFEKWEFQEIWAHSPEEEIEMVRKLISYLHDRYQQFPDMHVYHYNHTERSALLGFTEGDSLANLVEELETVSGSLGMEGLLLKELVEAKVFFDLLPVVRHSIQAGVESYTLKQIERLTDYERSGAIEKGAGAVLEYENYLKNANPNHLQLIAEYNEDDVRSTKAVRDWLIGLRASDLVWPERDLSVEKQLDERASETQIELLESPAGSHKRLLGHLFDYWHLEGKSDYAEKLIRLEKADFSDPNTVSGISLVGEQQAEGRKAPRKIFSYPNQEINFRDFNTCQYLVEDEFGKICLVTTNVEFDQRQKTVSLVWGLRSRELDVLPKAITRYEWVNPEPKPEALEALGGAVLEERSPLRFESAQALLRREAPKVSEGYDDLEKVNKFELDEVVKFIEGLDNSYLPIQGPPGTGKTWLAARIIYHLITTGKRVGITAVSHPAIDNLLKEVVDVFRDEGNIETLKAIRKITAPKPARDLQLDQVEYTTKNSDCEDDKYNLISGTTWLFARKQMRDQSLDYLFFDEAGQLGLADSLAAATTARNFVLLGDPQQLPQVVKASHPSGSGVSVLEHVLDGLQTIGSSQGVFLDVTYRMHPNISNFISKAFYEGRLMYHPDCANQAIESGMGIRWIPVQHDGCSRSSHEEATEVVRLVFRHLGERWTDAEGKTRDLEARDFMVVAPYNDQVRMIQEELSKSSNTRDVRVGTVDKFQGQQAPVLIYSLTSSKAELVPRSTKFLFSANRLNVALSRARCLAYMVGTEALLDSRARSIEEMKLISTLCSFTEEASRQQRES
ncbi:MAG: hypothetical protein CL512_03215 [Actinobacteria bacterium]|nr:hypothetical protein [Actinomycetota bacterium]